MYPVNKEISDFVEKKKHGDVLLPFVIYGTMMPTLFSSFPLHCHEEIEMILNDCGKCRYTVSGDDIDLFKKIGVNMTFEPRYQVKKLYHK